MVVKLHLFTGFINERLGISADMELGHLYEDTNSWGILVYAADKVGAKQEWAQNSNGFLHFDLWGAPLARAKKLFKQVSDQELATDMAKIASGRA